MVWENLGGPLCFVFKVVWKSLRNLWCLVFEVVWKNLGDNFCFWSSLKEFRVLLLCCWSRLESQGLHMSAFRSSLKASRESLVSDFDVLWNNLGYLLLFCWWNGLKDFKRLLVSGFWSNLKESRGLLVFSFWSSLKECRVPLFLLFKWFRISGTSCVWVLK